MRAGLATLAKCENLNVWAGLEKRAAAFCGYLNAEFQQRGWAWQMSRYGSLFWLRGATETPPRRIEHIPAESGARFARVFHAALERGIYLAPSGHEVGFISWAHTESLLEQAAANLLEAIGATY
jgi:glutamate-1-semialdehyde 2,1-aminomutase